tara:strand:- start:128 stop:853 length:726 start_codon:yes stop_codon:yes gene_type:complete
VKKKVILITGATSGIGRALSDFYYKKNYNLILTGSSTRKINNLKKIYASKALVKKVDLTNSYQVNNFVKECLAKFKKIDILIANAGIYEPSLVINGDPDKWDKVIAVNLSSVFRLINLVLPSMKKNKFGDIAITSSISGHQAIYWEPIYSATKHAIQSFAHGLRVQVSKYNIRVISIAPGVVLTELWNINPKKDKKLIKNKINKGEALRVEDIVDCFDFALNRPRHVTLRDLVILPTNQDI